VKAPDLSKTPPRRWNADLDGIKWLPRLIDKARAALAGTLGTYLYGQSPFDRALLRALGLGYRDFSRIVANAATDDDVFRELYARSPQGIERARVWGEQLGRRSALMMWIFDVDDGYAASPALAGLRPPANMISNLLTAMVKRLWPSRATEID